MPETRNIDFIKGGHWPLQTYGWSGGQWGASAKSPANSKSPTDKPPMIIGSQPPGAFAKTDDEWIRTFGASQDCVLSLIDGRFLDKAAFDITIAGIYKNAMPHIQDFNLFRGAKIGDDSIQQIQYIVGKDTVAEARTAASGDFAGVETELRGIGMRSPLMMAGWGKTVGLRPTDPEPSADSDKRKNDEEHKVSRETWKYGALDARWDERRGVWAAWHDLIADHESKNLGSLVFSTNSDASCGFPFLKGKLEDVWWVRKTPKFKDVTAQQSQDSDFIQSAEICTHLKHKLFDEARNTVGPLSDVFVVDQSDDSNITCGSEITSDGQIEILTSVFFHLNDFTHGPICFQAFPPNEEDLTGCMKFNGAEFVPAVTLDLCSHTPSRNIIDILFANDKSLEFDLNRVINAMNGMDITGTLTIINGKAKIDTGPIAQATTIAIQATLDTAIGITQTVNDVLRDEINAVLKDLVAQINICLEPLGCSITVGEVFGSDIDSHTAPPVAGGEIEGDVTGDVDIDFDGTSEHPAFEPVDPCEDGAAPIPPAEPIILD